MANNQIITPLKRVFLIGYMGAGKTTLGKQLAKLIHMKFIDLDHYIEARYLKSVNQLFNEKGEEGFRLIEKNLLLEVEAFEGVIIATGGGTPCFFDNMQTMNQCGVTVYLRNSNETLFQRLSEAQSKRPLIKDKSPDQLRDFIENSLDKRRSFYECSHLIFDADNIDNINEIEIASHKLLQLIETKD